MVENMHAWHDQPFATKRNGFDGLDVELLDQPGVRREAHGQLAAWQKDGSIPTAGAQGAADPKFVNGDCAMYIQSSPSSAASPAE
jgi:sn-glycerol 3-phosphate transport system substrate-binding protein